MRGYPCLALVIVACGEAPAVDELRIDGVVPDYAPLVGGTLITLSGAGFDAETRVLVDGRESPLVHALGTTHVELVVPPGARPGTAEIVVFERGGAAIARDMFHYSTPPLIANVSPADVVADSSTTVVTVTGAGFAAEGAGEPTLVLDGERLEEVTVVDDATLTFTAPGGRAFSRPALQVTNLRGKATESRAFRYTPSVNPGLLAFTRWGSNFAVFYDLVTHATVPIPVVNPAAPRMRTAFRDEQGTYWGIDTGSRMGRIDLETQTLVAASNVDRIPAIARAGAELYGIRRWDNAIGRLDRTTGQFTSLSQTPLSCCGSFAIAHDGTTLWVTARGSGFTTVTLSTFDPETGTTGTPLSLTGGPPGFRVEDMRFSGGDLYGTGLSSIVRIDPVTGVVTVLATPISERFTALELFP
jgi:hypothetical protein